MGSTTAATGPVTVSFTPGANNGNSAITNYTATCISSNGGANGTVTANLTALTVTLTTAKTYTCTVSAVNVRGLGLASTPSNALIVGHPRRRPR